MAREHGLTPKAIRSAREAIGVKIDRDGFGPGSKSLWSLPEPLYMGLSKCWLTEVVFLKRKLTEGWIFLWAR
jgi:hypothetical protein